MKDTDMHEVVKPCPVCGKKMIRRTLPEILLSNPPVVQYQWWCGNDGYQGDVERERDTSAEDRAFNQWRDANTDDTLYLYFLDQGHYSELIATGTDARLLQEQAKAYLRARYGETDVWAFENNIQLVHPNSPNPAGGGHYTDTLISSYPDLHKQAAEGKAR